MKINEIKKRLPITKVLAYYNIKLDKNNHIRCPFHDDDTPSCKIYPETNTFHCFGCGATGDQVEFCVKMEGDKHKGILKATELAGEEPIKHNAVGIALPKEPAKEVDFELLFGKLKESLPRSSKALSYLQERGLSPELEIGYNSGKYYKKMRECIIFPLKDKNGNITSLYGRRIMDSLPGKKNSHSLEFGKHYYSENRSGLYPCYPPEGGHGPNENTEILILTEAIIDAATLLQIPDITSQFTILSCFGNLAFVKEAQEAVKKLTKLQEIIIFFDGDQGGLDGIKHVSEILQQIKQGGLLSEVEVTAVATPEKEDINSLFVKYDKDCLIQLINERKPAEQVITAMEPSFSIETPLIEKEGISTSPNQHINTSPLNTTNPNKITYETQTARYIVKGGLPRQLDKMLISLDVQHLETALKYHSK